MSKHFQGKPTVFRTNKKGKKKISIKDQKSKFSRKKAKNITQLIIFILKDPLQMIRVLFLISFLMMVIKLMGKFVRDHTFINFSVFTFPHSYYLVSTCENVNSIGYVREVRLLSGIA